MPYSVYGVDPILISQAAQQAQAGTTPKSGNVITTISSAISGIAVPLLTALFPGGIKGNGSITPSYGSVPYDPNQYRSNSSSGLLDNIPLLALAAVAAYFLFFRKKKRKRN
ncbi:hypothetical protein [Salmonirosea aquatica]|uniref:Uncharacterized protein n=1 Tax=Salmonirosea aquatica TaxID=2654236 RepID=A0A7C9FQJ1_9BACT|nr:hypothetical protein [Cytophagaceae bacterium SJW1-29]MPR37151.1 hypothetical protein [Cytophagaceae bacterium SJW1-29]